MKFVLARKKYFSPSGFLSELVSLKYKDTPFKLHTYFVKTNVGFKRAKHYHKRKEEWMSAIWGKTLLRMKNVKTKKKKEYLLDSEAKTHKIIYVPPYWAHSIEAVGGNSAIIVFTPKIEDKKDSIPYEI